VGKAARKTPLYSLLHIEMKKSSFSWISITWWPTSQVRGALSTGMAIHGAVMRTKSLVINGGGGDRRGTLMAAVEAIAPSIAKVASVAKAMTEAIDMMCKLDFKRKKPFLYYPPLIR
jgi:hypothetical protein